MMKSLKDYPFKQSYQTLASDLYQSIAPENVPQPKLLTFNEPLVKTFSIDAKDKKELTKILSGNLVPTLSKPIALAYAGHQFGHYSPQLGDGRAVLLGQLTNSKNEIFDLQLKGSGKTQYSRQGDGKSPLSAVIREYIISEAMHALNIPTTRSLAIIATDEMVLRQEGMVPCGILSRIASSHIRIGTFEYVARLKNGKYLKALADYTISHHYPLLKQAASPYKELLNLVCLKQASLIAKWLHHGFIHGVMNTDNMTVSGETIDYGPCAFMDDFSFDKVFSSIDQNGRYAYSNQANIAKWNLFRLAETLLPLIDENIDKAIIIAQEILENYSEVFNTNYWQGLAAKLGYGSITNTNQAIIEQFLDLMQTFKADHTQSFRLLGDSLLSETAKLSLFKLFNNSAEIKDWYKRWQQDLTTDKNNLASTSTKMNAINPLYIPRNHIVEKVIANTIASQEPSEINNFLKALTSPFTENNKLQYYATPPNENEIVKATFCGT